MAMLLAVYVMREPEQLPDGLPSAALAAQDAPGSRRTTPTNPKHVRVTRKRRRAAADAG